MNRGMTEYRVHVQGKVEDSSEEVFHTYRCTQRPESMEEARKIAEDFQRIDKIMVEEVTTLTKTRIIELK